MGDEGSNHHEYHVRNARAALGIECHALLGERSTPQSGDLLAARSSLKGEIHFTFSVSPTILSLHHRRLVQASGKL